MRHKKMLKLFILNKKAYDEFLTTDANSEHIKAYNTLAMCVNGDNRIPLTIEGDDFFLQFRSKKNDVYYYEFMAQEFNEAEETN